MRSHNWTRRWLVSMGTARSMRVELCVASLCSGLSCCGCSCWACCSSMYAHDTNILCAFYGAPKDAHTPAGLGEHTFRKRSQCTRVCACAKRAPYRLESMRVHVRRTHERHGAMEPHRHPQPSLYALTTEQHEAIEHDPFVEQPSHTDDSTHLKIIHRIGCVGVPVHSVHYYVPYKHTLSHHTINAQTYTPTHTQPSLATACTRGVHWTQLCALKTNYCPCAGRSAQPKALVLPIKEFVQDKFFCVVVGDGMIG
jgi:hypothetical protein